MASRGQLFQITTVTFQRLSKQPGTATLDDFHRPFQVPGAGHCISGIRR